MAIQLNDRDHLIFKLIDEHQVLLEKHISWFISGEDKPVLIRDRLRKLFYLDYLLCHRHGTKLPWWTTPTKPLVYMLSPLTRSLTGAETSEVDLFDADVQRNLLEIANLRMLHLMDVKDNHISKFEWTTIKAEEGRTKLLDAKVKFICGTTDHRIGIVNHPHADESLVKNLEAVLQTEGVHHILIVSRDDAHQKTLQASICSNSALAKRCLFATHHELYKSGIAGTKWQCCDQKSAGLFVPAEKEHVGFINSFAVPHPISA
ncbi:MAG TPA: hypothetical protein V6C69_19390 [Trichormus sp.]|jgi:hypothetical protein